MSHEYKNNGVAIAQQLVEAVRTFGFRSTSEGRALGEIIAEEIVGGIALRSVDDQAAPTSGPWPVNSDNPPGKGYRSRKNKKYGTELTNVRTSQMLSKESLRGETVITDDLVEVRYGTGQPPSAAANGATLSNGDKSTSDIEKAYFAERQGRGFFELDDPICEATFNAVSKTLGEHLKNPGR